MGMYGYATFGVGLPIAKLKEKIPIVQLENFLDEYFNIKDNMKYVFDADEEDYFLYIFTEDVSKYGSEGAPIVELNIEEADKGSYALRMLIKERFNIDFPRSEFKIVGGTFYR